MIIHSFDNGDVLKKYGEALVACFSGTRSVLSTAPLGGGRRSDLKWVFNHGGEHSGIMKAPTYEEHVALIARDLGLEPEYCSGISTGALAENASIKTLHFEDLSVTAVVTGGIDVNAGRVGDTAHWHEPDGGFSYVAGTINIMLFIDANLTEGALVRSLVTCTEAKTAAIQELLLPSRYSCGLATGSGTDGTIIVANPSSPLRLTEAGKHFKLGELIGKTVMPAVKEALFLQTELSPERQLTVFRRLDRFGVTQDVLIEKAIEREIPYALVSEKIALFESDKDLAVTSSLYAHLLDQLIWGLIPEDKALMEAGELLSLLQMDTKGLLHSEDAKDSMINAFIEGLLNKIKK